jgi:uncharacterized membrane protein
MESQSAGPAPNRSSTLKTVGIVLLIVGLLLVAVGVMYLSIQNKDLPGFLGTLKGKYKHGHRTKRATASLVVGGLLLLGGIYSIRKKPAEPAVPPEPAG